MIGARPEMALHNKQQNQELNTNCYNLKAATDIINQNNHLLRSASHGHQGLKLMLQANIRPIDWCFQKHKRF